MNTINIERIKLARESRGYSQSALAKKMNTASQVLLSKIEKGINNVTDEVLRELCEILDYPQSFFYKKYDVYPLKHFYFRKNLGTSITKAKLLESQINILSGNICDLSDSVEIEVNLPFSDIYQMGMTPEVFADRVREFFKLPRGPIKNIVEAIEDQGIIVHFYDFNADLKISGVSFITSFGLPVMFINKNIPNSRKVFTMAHELGHILMHFKGGIIDENRDVENEADRFASSFLMPSLDIKNNLFGLTDRKLGELKTYWKVSIAALLYRAKTLGTLSIDQHRRWVTKISYYGWRKQEPLEFELCEPKILTKMIKLHLENLEYSKEDIMEMFGLNSYEFDRIYSYKELRQLMPDQAVQKLKLVI